MSWLKIDDKFTRHPKFGGWKPPEKWAWFEVMVYCAEYNTHGRIPEDLTLMPRSTTEKLLEKAEASGFIDRADDGGRVIHDWMIYNANTVAEKVAYVLAKHPSYSANDVYKEIGGTREVVLAEVKKLTEGGANGGS